MGHALSVSTVAGGPDVSYCQTGPALALPDSKDPPASFSIPKRIVHWHDPDAKADVLLITESGEQIRYYNPATARVSVFFDGKKAMKDLGFKESNLRALCVDPLSPKSFYLSDELSRIWKLNAGVLSFVCGSGERGYADGVGAAAKFKYVDDLLITKDGHTLYAADVLDHRVRAIDIKTSTVTTALGDGTPAFTSSGPLPTQCAVREPHSLVWADASETKIIIGSQHGLMQFDLPTGKVRARSSEKDWLYRTVVVSPSSALIVAGFYSVGTVAAISGLNAGEYHPIAGTGKEGYVNGKATDAAFNYIAGMAVSKTEHVLYVLDELNSCVRKIELPESLFVVPAATAATATATAAPTVADTKSAGDHKSAPAASH